MPIRRLGASELSAPPDTYFYALAQIDLTNLATIGSDDSLRIFDPNLRLISTVKQSGAFSCLKVCPELNAFVTAGRDGQVRFWDVRAKQQSTQFMDPAGRSISEIACFGKHIAVGTESTKEGLGDVSVLLFDARQPREPIRNYPESHTDTITKLAFHPQLSNVLLSGSTDGLVSIFNINHADEEDALEQVLNPRSAVHCAGFLSPDQVYVLTTDEQFLVYPLKEAILGAEPLPVQDFGDLRPKLNCKYAIDLVRQYDGSPSLACGHNEQQTLSVVQVVGDGVAPWGFSEARQMPGAHEEEVVRDLMFTQDRIYSCGEDGQVRLWRW